MPAYFVEQRHQSLAKMGLYTFFSFAGMAALGGWAADGMIRRGGSPVTVRKWFTIAGFLIACTELIGARSSSLTMAVTFAVVSLSGLGLATAKLLGDHPDVVPRRYHRTYGGRPELRGERGRYRSPIVTGWLKQQTGSYEAPMKAIWIVLVAGILSHLTMVREKYAPNLTA